MIILKMAAAKFRVDATNDTLDTFNKTDWTIQKYFIMITPQFITDHKGKKISVVLSMKDYQKLIEKLEDLEDVRLYDEVKARSEESIPFDEYVKQREKRKQNG